jgi:hypothetical protein
MLQDTEAAAELLAMLRSVAQDPLLGIVAGVCLQLGLRAAADGHGGRLESLPVSVSRIADSLSAAGNLSMFPKPLAKYFSQPSSCRYFDVQNPGNPKVSVRLLVGNIGADHLTKLRPSSGASSSSSLLLSAQSTQSGGASSSGTTASTCQFYGAPAAPAVAATARAQRTSVLTMKRPVPVPRKPAAIPRPPLNFQSAAAAAPSSTHLQPPRAVLVTTASQARDAQAAIVRHERMAVDCKGCSLSRSGRLCLVQVRCRAPICIIRAGSVLNIVIIYIMQLLGCARHLVEVDELVVLYFEDEPPMRANCSRVSQSKDSLRSYLIVG